MSRQPSISPEIAALLPRTTLSDLESIWKLEWSEEQHKLLNDCLLEFNSQFTNGNCTIYHISHSISVARIVACEMGLGSKLCTASLLHNLVESKVVAVASLKLKFDEEILGLLDGYQRISNFDVHRHTIESENFRKLLFNLAGDIRVLLIKLADRLYHVRSYEQHSVPGAERYLLEARHLYAGVAHRLGLYNLKTELEDLSLKHLEPEVFSNIERKINESKEEREVYIERFIDPLRWRLNELRIPCEIKGRSKSITGILAKMQKQKVDFEEVMDVFAIRVIIDSPREQEKELCWKVYSLVTDMYSPNPLRMRDWISQPRANGYESLHATVLGPEKKWVEVQIRSRRMDEDAEIGPAAHWRYKGEGEERKAEEWLLRFRELLEKPSESFGKTTMLTSGMYQDDIFVFTPKGDIRRLPVGSTVLDFAFEIHTEVGSRCTGAEVNGKRVPIRFVLNNADMVSISTSKSQFPKQDWLGFVSTSKAKNKIRKALKELEYRQAEFGKEILKKKLEQWKLPFNDQDIKKLLQALGLKDILQLYQGLAENGIDPAEIRQVLTGLAEKPKGLSQEKIKGALRLEAVVAANLPAGTLLVDENPDIKAYMLASCCTPVAGDEVFAFVTVAKGITVHKSSCPNAVQMKARYPYRVLSACWISETAPRKGKVTLEVRGIDRVGVLSQITDLISNKAGANLESVSFTSDQGHFMGTMLIEMQDIKLLDSLILNIRKVKGVESVARAS